IGSILRDHSQAVMPERLRSDALLSALDRQAFHAVERYLYREISLLLQHLLGVCAVIEYHSLKLSMNRRKEATCRGAFHIRYQDF
ncbi:hypothetical protein, partial [uncultured Cobetia sp.]|uniref:hypothetical protein n=1 Tax=uncultured Cobetia sp. TaxID=410706 RepID=UPI0030EF132C